jgi:uncharacterized membrane protein YagU involved in acid resistance
MIGVYYGESSRSEALFQMSELLYLVGGLEHFLFSIIYGIILPIEVHIFKMVKTTNQISL